MLSQLAFTKNRVHFINRRSPWRRPVNNTQNEYKYPTVFVLQKTGLTGSLQMPRQALGLQGER